MPDGHPEDRVESPVARARFLLATGFEVAERACSGIPARLARKQPARTAAS